MLFEFVDLVIVFGLFLFVGVEWMVLGVYVYFERVVMSGMGFDYIFVVVGNGYVLVIGMNF